MIYETVQFLNQTQLKTRPLVISYEGSDFAGADEIIYSATTVAELANIPASVTRLNIELDGPTSITGAFSGLKFLKSVIITSATLTAMTDCFTGCGMIEDMQLNLPNLQTISFVPQPALPTKTGMTNLNRNDRPYFRKLVLFSNQISAMTNLNAGTFYLISNLTVLPVDEYVGVVDYVDVRVTRLKCFVKHVNCVSRVADELEILDLDRFTESTDGFYDRYANSHIVGPTLRRGLSAFMADVLVYYGDLGVIDVDIVSCVVVDHVIYSCNSDGFYTQSTTGRFIFEFNAMFNVGSVNYYPYGGHSSFVAGDHYYMIGGDISNYINIGANIHYVNYRVGAILNTGTSLVGFGSGDYNDVWLLVPRISGMAGASTFAFGSLCRIRGAILDSYSAAGNSFQNSIIAAPMELPVVQAMTECFFNTYIGDVVAIGDLGNITSSNFMSTGVITSPVYFEAMVTFTGSQMFYESVILNDIHMPALTVVTGEGMFAMSIIDGVIHLPNCIKPGGFFMSGATVNQNQTFPTMYAFHNSLGAFGIAMALGVVVTLPILPAPVGFELDFSNQGTIIFADQTFP